jgi:hypothetical protein
MTNENVQEVEKNKNKGMLKAVRILKIVNGGLECLWGLPVIGGSLIVSLLWTPLILMLASHVVTLVLTSKVGKSKTGPILGVVTSVVGAIPGVGMIMHILTAIFNLIEGISDK